METLAQGVPADFRKIEISDQNLPQSWVDEAGIRLRVNKVRATPPVASFDLVIKATTEEPTGWRGAYALTIRFQPPGGGDPKEVEAKGVVSCTLG